MRCRWRLWLGGMGIQPRKRKIVLEFNKGLDLLGGEVVEMSCKRIEGYIRTHGGIQVK